MKTILPATKYRTVSLPEDLYLQLFEHAKKYKYRSMANFIGEAIRDKMKSDQFGFLRHR
jgi:metal-responsive CopG/Arc/MetJ family transcriptional regulator